MRPILFKIGPIPIHTYGLFLAIAFLVALYLVQRDSKRHGLKAEQVTDMIFWTLLVGIIGSRVLHMVMYPENYDFSNPIDWIALWNGGLVFQGGMAAGVVFCYFYMRRKSMDIWQVADVILPYLPLAHAIGRLGCFFGLGCCYGKPTTIPWAVRFPRIPADISQPATGSLAYLDQYGPRGQELWTQPIHPTQFYEAAGLVAIFFLLLYLRKHWHPYKGFVLAAYMVSYGVLRFIVELYRGDHNPTHFTSITDQQVFSLLFAAAGLVLYFIMRRRPALRTA